MPDEKALIEAALFASGKSMSYGELSKLSGLEPKRVKELALQLAGEYESRGSGVQFVAGEKSAGMHLSPLLEEKVMHLIPQSEMPKAMLRTLALIAHDQPVRQSDLIKSRGNRTYYYLKRLHELDFITSKQVGRTKMLSTTPKFRQYFRVEDVGNVKQLVKQSTITESPEMKLAIAGSPETKHPLKQQSVAEPSEPKQPSVTEPGEK